MASGCFKNVVAFLADNIFSWNSDHGGKCLICAYDIKTFINNTHSVCGCMEYLIHFCLCGTQGIFCQLSFSNVYLDFSKHRLVFVFIRNSYNLYVFLFFRKILFCNRGESGFKRLCNATSPAGGVFSHEIFVTLTPSWISIDFFP